MTTIDCAQDEHELEHGCGLYEEIDEHFASSSWYYDLRLGHAWSAEDDA